MAQAERKLGREIISIRWKGRNSAERVAANRRTHFCRFSITTYAQPSDLPGEISYPFIALVWPAFYLPCALDASFPDAGRTEKLFATLLRFFSVFPLLKWFNLWQSSVFLLPSPSLSHSLVPSFHFFVSVSRPPLFSPLVSI